MLVRNWMSKEVITIDINDFMQNAETLMKELNMQEISEHLEKLATIVSNFSIQQCMV